MLEINNLSAGYDTRPVIHDITLTVAPGEILALIGANGAGKSTLARTLSGLLPALGGTIRFQNHDLTKTTPAARVRAGLVQVPEGRQIFASLTVAQNLELGAYLNPTPHPLETIFTQFPILQTRADTPAGNLSGGQQQMLAIGRALMARPQLLILDEPSLGLAPNLVAEIFRLIATLRAQGIAILLSEQNARMSLAIADRAAVIENGRITLTGPAAELAASPDIAARYLGLTPTGATPRLDGAMTRQLTSLLRT